MDPQETSNNGGDTVVVSGYEMLSSLMQVVEVLRDKAPQMPMQLLHVYLCVAQREGRTVKELCLLTGLSQPAVNRNLMEMEAVNRHRKPGLGLVKREPDPVERRRMIFFLTPEGRNLSDQIMQALETQHVTVTPLKHRSADEFVSDYVARLRGSGLLDDS